MATEINTKYDPIAVEDKWYKFWMDNHFFHSEPDSRPAYSIVIPPPNVTGVLHMGHMLNIVSHVAHLDTPVIAVISTSLSEHCS